MKELPVVILLALAFVLRLLRRRRSGGTGPRWTLPGAGGRARLGPTGLVAGREIRERVRGRLFRVVTAVLFLVVAAAVVIPAVHRGTAKRPTIGVVAGSPALQRELHALARSVGLTIAVVAEPGLDRARAALAAGRVDLVVQGTTRLLVDDPIAPSDTSSLARLARVVSTALGEQRAYARAGLTGEQATVVAGAAPLAVGSLHAGKPKRTTAQATALLGVVFIFVVLSQYLGWTLMGVMEEKASRVVEVLLATVRPLHLLAGKVVGIGAVALAQAAALVVFALVLARAVGSSLAQGAAPVVVAATLVWLVLGYALYSWVYAAAGAMAERQDQAQSLVLPLSAPLLLGYIASLTSAGSGAPSLLVKVLAYLPPTAPFAMPTLVGFGAVTWWQFLLSVALSLAATAAAARGAAAVYRAAVLRTGGRVHLRELRSRPAG